ncbi:hypothetical protein H696_05188 [Fonticula alba]|uniref:Transcription initiation factor IIE subunit alpha n=1 Tax=Fonticula alba TaxID=691883 RepID=A0A058Z2A0_FONAL|nr:hypothetical protein H696_05188 [Fonticula alba]KCV68266.1 hypothetical protein H696_05188 [Fonticula alba]|eukprot:XP_009497320.1 hypothetical protein H696_05188 [Fonticula alba]
MASTAAPANKAPCPATMAGAAIKAAHAPAEQYQEHFHETFKRLVRITARMFFQSAHVVILDALLTQRCTAQELSAMLHLSQNRIQTEMGALKGLVKIEKDARENKSKAGQMQNIDLFRIDCLNFIVLIRWKVEMLNRQLDSASAEENKKIFRCNRCDNTYTFRGAMFRMTQTGGNYVCPEDETVLDSIVRNDPQPNSERMLSQLKPLLNLLEEVQKMNSWDLDGRLPPTIPNAPSGRYSRGGGFSGIGLSGSSDFSVRVATMEELLAKQASGKKRIHLGIPEYLMPNLSIRLGAPSRTDAGRDGADGSGADSERDLSELLTRAMSTDVRLARARLLGLDPTPAAPYDSYTGFIADTTTDLTFFGSGGSEDSKT